MRIEAPVGVAYSSKENPISPRQAEGRFPINNHQFPQSLGEFIDQLRRDLPRLAVDWLSLGNDLARGFLEREDLYKALNNGGIGNFRGDGSVVFMAPGFGSFPAWYEPAAEFLERAGYRPVLAPFDFIINVEPIEKKRKRYIEIIMDLVQQSGQKLHYVGDSQGGLTGAALAVDYPEEFQGNVADAWFIGAPKPRRVNVLVGLAYLWTQLWGNDFRLAGKLAQLAELEADGRMTLRSIYRRGDVVLPDGEPIGEHFPTEDSHTGGAVNLKHLKLIVSTWNHKNSI